MAIATAGGVAKVVVPLVLGLLVVRFAINIPWPRWNIPWPNIDLPRIPWPEIPWPVISLPDWQVPEWVGWVAEKMNYVGPVLLAFALAKGETHRRRRQDALKAERMSRESPAGPAGNALD